MGRKRSSKSKESRKNSSNNSRSDHDVDSIQSSESESVQSPLDSNKTDANSSGQNTELQLDRIAELVESALSHASHADGAQFVQHIQSLQSIMFEAILREIKVKDPTTSLSLSDMAAVKELVDAQRDFDAELLENKSLREFLEQNASGTSHHNTHRMPTSNLKHAVAASELHRITSAPAFDSTSAADIVSETTRSASSTNLMDSSENSRKNENQGFPFGPRRILSWWHRNAESTDIVNSPPNEQVLASLSRSGSKNEHLGTGSTAVVAERGSLVPPSKVDDSPAVAAAAHARDPKQNQKMEKVKSVAQKSRSIQTEEIPAMKVEKSQVPLKLKHFSCQTEAVKQDAIAQPAIVKRDEVSAAAKELESSSLTGKSEGKAETLLAEMKAQLERSIGVQNKLQEDFAKESRALADSKAIVKSLSEELRSKNDEMIKKNLEFSSVQNENATIRKHSAVLQDDVSKQKSQLDVYAIEIEQLKNTISELQQESSQLKMLRRRKEDELQESKSKIEESDIKLNELSKLVESLKVFRDAESNQSQSNAEAQKHKSSGGSRARFAQRAQESFIISSLKLRKEHSEISFRHCECCMKERDVSSSQVDTPQQQTDAIIQSSISHNDLTRLSIREETKNGKAVSALATLQQFDLNQQQRKELEDLEALIQKKSALTSKGSGSVSEVLIRHRTLSIQCSVMDPSGKDERGSDWFHLYRSFCRWIIAQEQGSDIGGNLKEIEGYCRTLNALGWERVYTAFFRILMDTQQKRADRLRRRDAELDGTWYLEPWYCVQARDLQLEVSMDILKRLFSHMTSLNVKNLLVLVNADDEVVESHVSTLRRKLLRLMLREAGKQGFRVVTESRYNVLPTSHIWCQRALSGNQEFADRFVRRDEWRKDEQAPSNSLKGQPKRSSYVDSDGIVTQCAHLLPEQQGGGDHLISALVGGKPAKFFSPYGTKYMALDLCSPDLLISILERVADELNDLELLGKLFCDFEFWIGKTGASSVDVVCMESVAFFKLLRALTKTISPRSVFIGRSRFMDKFNTNSEGAGLFKSAFDAFLSNTAHEAILMSSFTESASFYERFLSQLDEQQTEQTDEGHPPLIYAIDNPFVSRSFGEIDAAKDGDIGNYMKQYSGSVYARFGDFIEGSEDKKHFLVLLLLYLAGRCPMLFSGVEFLASSEPKHNVIELSDSILFPRLRESLLEERLGSDEATISFISELNKLFLTCFRSNIKPIIYSSAHPSIVLISIATDSSLFVAANLGEKDGEIQFDVSETLIRLQLPVGFFKIERELQQYQTQAQINIEKDGLRIFLGSHEFCVFRLVSTVLDSTGSVTESSEAVLYRKVSADASFLPVFRSDRIHATVRPFVIEWNAEFKSSALVTGSFNKWKDLAQLFPLASRITSRNAATDNSTLPSLVNVVFASPGSHEFKFIVDGSWQCSTGFPLKYPNKATSDGVNNNVIQVADFDQGGASAETEDRELLSKWHDHLMLSIRNESRSETRDKSVLLPRVFLWTAPGAQKVFVCGSFDGWRDIYPLVYSTRGNYHWVVLNLPVGVCFYRFIVDGAWCVSLRDPHDVDDTGFESNIMQVL
eukprot:CAMPEP_0182450724 /NCGR_PEP_ID=MMETSP1172-20130603/43286_1 /TAXON_ID=708627 /ORGANISM="Timspurckia oligopyrenoides, Strain CCMP3278" /LENGTH=1575 /DNA_ID=CAMNT_0024648441 /DNA_START=60 /DNA_END=4787 /DNA_ORIENTATION=-